MRTITRENLPEFAPDYPPYEERLQEFAASIGQDNPIPNQEHGKFLRQWNESSAIGFSEAELEILELIYSVDHGNARFDQDRFIHAAHGGNTAAHPIFMGLAFDRFKDVAKLGAADFDPTSPESLELAKLSQRVHGMIAVHDAGEVVDVSFAEQRATLANFKEPKEEELVAPFKFKLAAYALSIGNPQLYVDIATSLKTDALAEKNALYLQAVSGKISGDDFVRGFGEVIGRNIEKAEKQIDPQAIRKEYRQAVDTLGGLFEEAEEKKTAAGQLLGLVDKYEGAAHYAYFAGKAAKEHAQDKQEQDSEKRMYSRLFGAGDNLSYVFAGSADILSQLTYSQKPIPAAFAAAEAEPEATRDMTRRLAGAAAGGLLRSCIALMQKSAPFIDFDAQANDVAISPTAQPREQQEHFTSRLASQRDLRDTSIEKLKERKGHVTEIGGVMDTKAVIAVLHKAAEAMENGEWQPEKGTGSGMVFDTGKPLPPALQVTPLDMKRSAQQHPLDVAVDYRHDRMEGQAVRI